MSRLAPFAAGLALGLGMASVVSMLRRPDPRRSGPQASIQDVLEHHEEALGLDQVTLDQVWAIANGAREELDGYRAAIRAHKEELKQILDADQVDRTRMAAAVEAIGRRESQLRRRELEVMLEIRALLSREQIEAFKKLRPPPPRQRR